MRVEQKILMPMKALIYGATMTDSLFYISINAGSSYSGGVRVF